jgi:uncharacterized protein YjbJ (UPF0337 family)
MRRFSHVPCSASKKGDDMSSGTVDNAKGRVKEVAGALTGDKTLKAKGKVDELAGKTKDATKRMIDKVKETFRSRPDST